jgi:probable rRNA maturation factor
VVVAGRAEPLSRTRVVKAVELVLDRERSRARVAITFVGATRIRRLNARWKGVDGPTDVLAFTLPLPDGSVLGDVYICRPVALREARARNIPATEELTRLVIHGTLHVIGHDHPEGSDRTRSPMWRRQERYLACLG